MFTKEDVPFLVSSRQPGAHVQISHLASAMWTIPLAPIAKKTHSIGPRSPLITRGPMVARAAVQKNICGARASSSSSAVKAQPTRSRRRSQGRNRDGTLQPRTM
eukprot:1192375-Prorocentrum_minimum.AAC.1